MTEYLLLLIYLNTVCIPNSHLERLQERNTLDEGLVHPPLLCVIFNNQSVKCGSILREKQNISHVFHEHINTHISAHRLPREQELRWSIIITTTTTHQGPQGALLRGYNRGSSWRVVHERQLTKAALIVVLSNAHTHSILLHENIIHTPGNDRMHGRGGEVIVRLGKMSSGLNTMSKKKGKKMKLTSQSRRSCLHHLLDLWCDAEVWPGPRTWHPKPQRTAPGGHHAGEGLLAQCITVNMPRHRSKRTKTSFAGLKLESREDQSVDGKPVEGVLRVKNWFEAKLGRELWVWHPFPPSPREPLGAAAVPAPVFWTIKCACRPPGVCGAARPFWDARPEALCRCPRHRRGCTPLHRLRRDKHSRITEPWSTCMNASLQLLTWDPAAVFTGGGLCREREDFIRNALQRVWRLFWTFYSIGIVSRLDGWV